MTDQDKTPIKKPWYLKWWIWILIVLGVLIVAAALTPISDEDEAASDSTTSASEVSEFTTTTPDETATSTEPTTTTTLAPTTTQPPTTTTTLPPILAEGSGSGDDVVDLNIPSVAVVIELTHDGGSNFAVWSLDVGFDTVELLANEIGRYVGTRGMQFTDDEVIAGLEISANGNWTYEIRPLAGEPSHDCPFGGSGDSITLFSFFTGSGGRADLTHNGDSNFAVWAWGASDRDLLVNEIGAYEGTVRVASGLFVWDISADGDWTVNCS